MSQYTYANLFTESPQDLRNCIIAKGYIATKKNLVFIRQGKHRMDELKENLFHSERSLVYSAPVTLSKDFEEGDILCYVLFDEMEDTGNTHTTELYRVEAFQGVVQVDEFETAETSPTPANVIEYYEDKHNLTPNVTF